MSRSSGLVVVGSLWTLTTYLAVGQLLFPTSALLDSAVFLATSVVASAGLIFVSALYGSTHWRTAALQLHMALPLLWTWELASTTGVALGYQAWILPILCGFVGSVLSERGLRFHDQLQQDVRTETWLDEIVMPIAAPSSAWQSGGFARPTLAACDSGGFRIP